MPSPYNELDKQLKTLKHSTQVEFNRLSVMSFDELNVVSTKQVVKEMFGRFLANNLKAYLKVARRTYKQMCDLAAKNGYKRNAKTDIEDDYIDAILTGYDLITGYIYETEAERKRLRLCEEMLTAKHFLNKQAYNSALKKAANYWYTQTAQYGISIVDTVALQAFKDFGVQLVKWNAEIDNRTCSECSARDGKVYPINKVPPKEHYGCRCWITPVQEG